MILIPNYWEQTIINCPNGVNCDIICEGTPSCYELIINCPFDENTPYECNVECSLDNFACSNTHIYGYGTLSCYDDNSCQFMRFPLQIQNEPYTFVCDGWFQCYRSTLFCPENAECHIYCSDDYNSCDDLTINTDNSENIAALRVQTALHNIPALLNLLQRYPPPR